MPTDPCLTRCDFDSRAFGFPYYRLIRSDFEALPSELRGLAREGPFAADAKVPADDVAASHALFRCGFQKVCMQIVFFHDLSGAPRGLTNVGVTIADPVSPAAHAWAFRCRFLSPAAGETLS